VAEVLNRCCLHGYRHSSFAYLLQNEFKDVFAVFQTQAITQNLPEQDFRHVTQDYFVLPHQRLKKDLINLVVGGPVVADHMISNRLNKLFVQVVVRSFVLNVGVSVADQAFSVVNFHVSVVRTNHVQSKQVDHSLFPGHWGRLLQVADCFCTIVFNAIQRYFVRHIALTSEVGHWIHLQENEVRHVLGNNIDEKV
jgi:hypothetical protein